MNKIIYTVITVIEEQDDVFYVLFKHIDGLRQWHYTYNKNIELCDDAADAWQEYVEDFVFRKDRPSKEEWKEFSGLNNTVKGMK